MPHAEIKCSSDIDADFDALFAAIENTILSHDGNSGACKCRAYPTDFFRHTHILVNVAMLTKDHRDDAFTRGLMAGLEQVIKSHLRQDCYFSLSLDYMALDYMGETYITNTHAVG